MNEDPRPVVIVCLGSVRTMLGCLVSQKDLRHIEEGEGVLAVVGQVYMSRD